MAGFWFSVTAEEWDHIGRLVYPSVAPDEHDVTGHLRVELRGAKRTWVATDGAQLSVLEWDGEPAMASDGPLETADVMVNPRLLRGQPPADCTIEVDVVEVDGGTRRDVFVVTDGVRSGLPEHPADYPERQEILDAIQGGGGATAWIDREVLLRALAPTRVRPTGSDDSEQPPVMMGVVDGKLWLEVIWEDLPATQVTAPVNRHDGETRVWLDPERLWTLVVEIEADEVELVLPEDESGPLMVRASGYTALLMPIDRLRSPRRRLEELLCLYLGLDEVVRDDDGDYPVHTRDDVVYFVRLDDPDQPTVRVFAVIADDVEPSLELLTELNAINAGSTQLKAILVEGSVMAEIELVATSLDLDELSFALDRVTEAVRSYRPLLEAFFSPSAPLDD